MVHSSVYDITLLLGYFVKKRIHVNMKGEERKGGE